MTNDTTRKSNALIHESSPYLLQHAYNPVHWQPWSTAAFDQAKRENKLVLVSVGYSSCHWCHVMERESFEDTMVATVMNENFVCIKVDREERPDVDDVYMTAVQLMTGQGGWPLNCFALPDGRPVFGGTYFPKSNWVGILGQLSKAYENDQKKFEEYAAQLTEGISQAELIERPAETEKFESSRLDEMIVNWKRTFDPLQGGNNRAPKFPMPNSLEFLMAFAHQRSDSAVMKHVDLTLHKMAMGGLYDQVGGGFSRYSVDSLWKVPHFEKMLYDNAQLLSVYALGYQRTGDALYKEVIEQTIAWLRCEMAESGGSFYSALDADSEGVEGKFYVWNETDLKKVLGRKYDFAKDYFGIGTLTEWEGNHILLRPEYDTAFCEKFGVELSELGALKKPIIEKLYKERSKRIRPGLDDKSLTSWNAMAIVGLLDAYNALGKPEYLEYARENANWICQSMMKSDSSLWHTYKNNIGKIDGFLDDYSFVIEAFIKLYEVTFELDWLVKAKSLADYAIAHFYHPESGMFYYTSDLGEQLIARKMEISDNVIPASNSSMAKALFKLGTLLDNKTYISMSEQMLANVYDGMEQYGSGYSNWGLLALMTTEPFYSVAITGPKCVDKRNELARFYLPNCIVLGGISDNLPGLKGKILDQTTIFVCVESYCKRPTDDVQEALGQMK